MVLLFHDDSMFPYHCMSWIIFSVRMFCLDCISLFRVYWYIIQCVLCVMWERYMHFFPMFAAYLGACMIEFAAKSGECGCCCSSVHVWYESHENPDAKDCMFEKYDDPVLALGLNLHVFLTMTFCVQAGVKVLLSESNNHMVKFGEYSFYSTDSGSFASSMGFIGLHEVLHFLFFMCVYRCTSLYLLWP